MLPRFNLRFSRLFWWRLSPRGRLLVVGSGLIAILIASVPTYRAFKLWRANSLAARAAELASHGDMQAAHELAAASLHLAPHSLRNRRRFVEDFHALDSESALAHSHALAKSNEALPDDLRRYVRLCLDHEIAADAIQALQRLLEQEPDHVENWLLAAQYEETRGESLQALAFLDQALSLDASHVPTQILAATIAARDLRPNLRHSGRQRLLGIARKEESQHSLHALCVLADLPQQGPHTGEAKQIIEMLESHPLADSEHRLAAAKLRYLTATTPGARKQVIETVVSTFPISDRPAVLSWLNHLEEYERVLEMVSVEDASEHRTLFLIRSMAMLEAGQARPLLAMLESPVGQWPIRHSTQLFLALQAANVLELDTKAEGLYTNLIQQANRNQPPLSLLTLAQKLAAKELTDHAIATYLFIHQNYPAERPHVYDRLTRLHREKGNARALLTLTQTMIETAPSNLVYRHNQAYLSLLLEESTEAAKATLTRLAHEYRLAASTCALALHAHLQGQVDSAQALVEPLDWATLSPLSQRLVRLIHPAHAAASGGLKPLRMALFPEEAAWFQEQTVASVPDVESDQ